MRMKSRFYGVVVLISVLFLPITAFGINGDNPVILNIIAHGSGEFEQDIITDLDWDDDIYAFPDERKTWNLPEPIDFDFGGGHTASINTLSIAIEADPAIQLGFSAVSNNGAATFLITSPLLVFEEPLTNAEGYIYAEAGSLPGTTVSPVNYDPKLLRTLYNDTEIFADAVAGYSFVPGGVYDWIDWTPISGEVSNMQAIWSLEVSSGGHSSGLATYEIRGDVVPEPATVLLFGLGGLAWLRKRRS